MIYGKADLHIHTTNSDGKYSVEEIRNKISASGGNKLVSITDHNYMTDKKIFKENDILSIPGIEISAMANGIPVHITGYGLEPMFSDKLKSILKKLVDGYNNRAKKIAKIEKERGLNGQQEKTGEKIFVEEENFMPDVTELIPAMHESKMLACRAHPGKKSFRNPAEVQSGGALLDYIFSAGIDGIEVFSHTHTQEQSDFFIKEAKKRNLLITGGSDYHGDEAHDFNFSLSSTYVHKFLEAIGYYE